jgi:signal peptidase I
MKKKLAFIFETIFTILIIGLCGLIIAMSKGFHPSIGGYEVLRVITPSMEPELPLDTLILIKDVDEGDLKEGDIITFISEDPSVKGFYVTHRIYKITESAITGDTIYVTKGDANVTEDLYTVKYEDIAGRFVRIIPGGNTIGKWIAGLENNGLYFLIILLPILLVLITYIWQIMSIILLNKDDDADNEEETEQGDSTEN